MSIKDIRLICIDNIKILAHQNTLTKCARVLLFFIRLTLSIPLIPISLLFLFSKYRYVNIFVDRIGHLAIEPDILIKSQLLGEIKNFTPIVLAPKYRVSNNHLLRYWKNYLVIIQNPIACLILRSIFFWGIGEFSVSKFMRNIGSNQSGFAISSRWGNRDPLLKASKEDEQWLKESLDQLGLPEGSWFVCIHNREGGFSPIDEHIQHHRNCDIENMRGAIEEITLRGGWVIRLGDPTMKAFKNPPSNYIEYAHSKLKSERMDILLCAKAKFLLGNTSGIALVASVFGTPCALSNMTPISALGIGKKDISIPKLYYSYDLKRILTISELISMNLESCQYANFYDAKKISLIENSNEEIRELALEMFDNLGSFTNEADPLQEQFKNLLSDQSYSHGSPANLARVFLKKYIHLFK